MIKVKKKPSYSLYENIKFYLKNQWYYNKKLTFLAVIRILTIVFVPLLTLYLPKIVIKDLSDKASMNYLILHVGLFSILLMILNTLDGYLKSYTTWSASKNRSIFFAKFLHKLIDTDFENIDNPKFQIKKEKASKAINSNSAAFEAISNNIIEFIADFIGFFIYGNILFMLNPILIVIIFLTTVFSYLAKRVSQNYEYRNKDNWTPIDKKINYLNSKSGEFKFGKDIRIYDMKNWFKKMFFIFTKERMVWRKKVARRWITSGVVEGVLILARDAICYIYIIYMILNQWITPDDFILYFGTISGFSVWITGILKKFNSLNRMSLSICDFRDFLNIKDKHKRDVGIELPPKNNIPLEIEFKNVSYTYPEATSPTINNFNLKVKPGEKIAIVGVNGAGKTTLIKLLCGLYSPHTGEILVNGHSIDEYNIYEYYSLISAIFQDINILPYTIAKNIAQCSEEGIDKNRLRECLELAGLNKKVSSLNDGYNTILVKGIFDDAIDLSGGENQKLMLARALYKNAPILILDEPTAALDPISENELYMKYAELCKDKTSFFISHRLSSTRFCDRIVFIENGTIKEIGTHDELIKLNGSYAKMFEIQSHYYKEKIEDDEIEKIR